MRCGGFTRAAADLRLAQPVVSAHITRLELELGVTLLHRARPVSLSAAGESFLPYVRRALASLDEGERTVRAFRSVSVGHVRVAATSLLGGFDLVSTIGRFRLRYPGVTVSLRTGLIADLLDELHRERVDVVVGPVGEEWEQEGSRRTEIADERLVLITPLSTARRVGSLADVVDEPFVCLSSDSGLRRLLNTAFSAIDAVPRVEFETHSPASIREMVAAGLGCALIAQSAVDKEGPDVQVHCIQGLPPHPPIAAISASDAAPPIARFVDELTAARSASRTAGAPPPA